MIKKKVIAFIGRIGSGKNYNSDKLVEMGYLKLSFADPLRVMACSILGLDYNEVMKEYETFKQEKVTEKLTFRNILENVGESIRKENKNFWINILIKKIKETDKNVCIDDMRYTNEFLEVYKYCASNNIEFKAYFTDYRSERYCENNTHSSSNLSNYLASEAGLKDGEEITFERVATFEHISNTNKLRNKLKEVISDEIKNY